MKKAYLVLSDGTVMEGKRFGADTACIGELVFTTGMCGYIETLSDPSYGGQIVMQTFPLIGNYGIIPDDFEGKPCLKGYAVREYCDTPSNFRCEETLDSYLKKMNIPGICGIDTREITRKIREYGVINAGIFDEIPEDLSVISSYRVSENILSEVSCKQISEKRPDEEKYHVVLMDFGAKKGGYCADMTRTVSLGRPSDEMQTIYGAVLLAQETCETMLAPGKCCFDIDAEARRIIDAAGYAGRFGHGLGHSVGIDIHEDPRLSPACGDLLEPGVTITVEPGIYVPGLGGVRIENTCVVTENGGRTLVHAQKALLIL